MAMNRPTVIVDLDNVVFPWTQQMAHIIAKHTSHGASEEELMAAYRTWNVWEDWGIPKGQFMWEWDQAIKTGEMYLAWPPYEGAAQALWKISDMEWHIHIVTARLNRFRQHEKVITNTVKWLAHFGIPYRSLSFAENKTDIIAQAIIDDKPSNLVGHLAQYRMLFPAPHNRQFRSEMSQDSDIIALTETTPWEDVIDTLAGTNEWT